VAQIKVGDVTIDVDSAGFLKHLDQWNVDVAQHIAEAEGIVLTDQHWEILWLLRDFYAEFALSPAMRPLVKYVAQKLGTAKGNSAYLLGLFPDSPAKRASKIAGLPRPDHCL
jgi:tRNA 2-thiouridine synthesizing protein E